MTKHYVVGREGFCRRCGDAVKDCSDGCISHYDKERDAKIVDAILSEYSIKKLRHSTSEFGDSITILNLLTDEQEVWDSQHSCEGGKCLYEDEKVRVSLSVGTAWVVSPSW